MNIRQIEAFHATMKMGTITRAAEILCVSQPSVSRLIADLEKDIGFELFKRKNRRIYPTPEGIRFFSEVKRIYDGIDSLKKTSEEIRKEQQKHIRISAIPAFSTSLIPKIMKDIIKQDPKLSFTLNSRSPGRITDDLIEGRADVAFCVIRAEMPGIIQEKIGSVDCICALPPGHPLTEKEVITPDHLRGEKIITLDDSKDLYWEKHAKMLKKHGIKTKARLSTQRSHAAYAMVRENLGIGLLEPFSAERWQKVGVVIKQFSPPISYDFTVSFPSNRIRTAQTIRIAKLAKKYFKKPFYNHSKPKKKRALSEQPGAKKS